MFNDTKPYTGVLNHNQYPGIEDELPELLHLIANRIFDQPDAWTTHQMARNVYGVTVPWVAEQACQFCALGFIATETQKRYDVENDPRWQQLSTEAHRALYHSLINDQVLLDDGLGSVPRWNDKPGREAQHVAAAFRLAAEYVQDFFKAQEETDGARSVHGLETPNP